MGLNGDLMVISWDFMLIFHGMEWDIVFITLFVDYYMVVS